MFPSHLNHMSSHCFFWRMNPDPKTRHVWHPTWSQIMCSRISWVFGGCLVCQYISGLSFLKKLAPIPPKKKKHTHTIRFFPDIFPHTPPPNNKITTPTPKKNTSTTTTLPNKKKTHTKSCKTPTDQPTLSWLFFPYATFNLDCNMERKCRSNCLPISPQTAHPAKAAFFLGGRGRSRYLKMEESSPLLSCI